MFCFNKPGKYSSYLLLLFGVIVKDSEKELIFFVLPSSLLSLYASIPHTFTACNFFVLTHNLILQVGKN